MKCSNDGIDLHRCPAFSISDKSNCALGNICNDGNRVGRYSLVEKFSYVYNSFAGKFAAWLLFSSQVYKTCLPLKTRIFGKANPFKIFVPIVSLDTIDMVYRQFRAVSRNKSHADKAVYRVFKTLSISEWGYFRVPMICYVLGKRLALKTSRVGLYLPIPNSAVISGVVKSFYSPQRTYEQRHSFRFNLLPNFHHYLRLLSSNYSRT